jgi:hypothetical protein
VFGRAVKAGPLGRSRVPVKLTARNVMTLSSQGRPRADYLDEVLQGFELRVSSENVRTFAVRYFRDGKVRRYTIGRTPPLSLADARDIGRRILGDVMKGGDPHAEKVAQRRKRSQRTQTFGSLCERFLDEARTKDNLPLRPTTLYNWCNIAKVEVLPVLGGTAPDAITRRDVRLLVEGIAVKRPYWANRVFELVRRVFSWAMEKDLVDASRVSGSRSQEARNRATGYCRPSRFGTSGRSWTRNRASAKRSASSSTRGPARARF